MVRAASVTFLICCVGLSSQGCSESAQQSNAPFSQEPLPSDDAGSPQPMSGALDEGASAEPALAPPPGVVLLDPGKGNNGIGNGLDPDAPGSPRENDAAGSSPGNPGTHSGGPELNSFVVTNLGWSRTTVDVTETIVFLNATVVAGEADVGGSVVWEFFRPVNDPATCAQIDDQRTQISFLFGDPGYRLIKEVVNGVDRFFFISFGTSTIAKIPYSPGSTIRLGIGPFISGSSFVRNPGVWEGRILERTAGGVEIPRASGAFFTLKGHNAIKPADSGDDQSAPPGTELDPFVVAVNGVSTAVEGPKPNVPVTFSIFSQPPGAAGATLVAESRTDANGRAKATLTLGDQPGVYRVRATTQDACQGRTLEFTAESSAEIRILSGDFDGLPGIPTQPLDQPFKAIVIDPTTGLPLPGATVRFSILGEPSSRTTGTTLNAGTESGRTVSPKTDGSGVAEARLILGDDTGIYRVLAELPGVTGAEVVFKAATVDFVRIRMDLAARGLEDQILGPDEPVYVGVSSDIVTETQSLTAIGFSAGDDGREAGEADNFELKPVSVVWTLAKATGKDPNDALLEGSTTGTTTTLRAGLKPGSRKLKVEYAPIKGIRVVERNLPVRILEVAIQLLDEEGTIDGDPDQRDASGIDIDFGVSPVSLAAAADSDPLKVHLNGVRIDPDRFQITDVTQRGIPFPIGKLVVFGPRVEELVLRGTQGHTVDLEARDIAGNAVEEGSTLSFAFPEITLPQPSANPTSSGGSK